LVTARHVAGAASRDHEYVIRANLKSGKSEPIPVTGIDWAYPDDERIDLAVAPYYLDQRKYDLGYYHLGQAAKRAPFVDERGVTRRAVVCGDEIAIAGLFHLHSGVDRNVPVVHTGHVAVLADPSSRIPLFNKITERTELAEAHLVETQSLDGLSGSPAYIFEWMDLPIPSPTGNKPQAHVGVKLLGIYVGSWDGDPNQIMKEDRRLSDGTKVPVGMGVVVPADHLMDLIRDHPKLIAGRERDREEALNANAASTDFMAPAVPPADDANPNHRDDFNSLLNKAAKPPKAE
jgi:hypothetical protein